MKYCRSGLETGLSVVLGEGHLAGGAVAVDLEEGRGGFQVEFAGEASGVVALEAGAELTADAVSGVHERSEGGRLAARFECGCDRFHSVVTIDGLGEVVGDVVGGDEVLDRVGNRWVLLAALVHGTGNAVGSVQQIDSFAAQL